jgi:hypothetical protein
MFTGGVAAERRMDKGLAGLVVVMFTCSLMIRTYRKVRADGIYCV